MIKEEKINRARVYRRVKENLEKLTASGKTIESIFNITFSHPNFTLFNVMQNAGVKEVSYGDAKTLVAKLGTLLQKQIGPSHHYVGLLLTNKPEWVYSFYGLLMYGYVPILLSTQNLESENIRILNEVGAKVLVTENGGYQNFQKINPCSQPLNTVNELAKPNWANEILFISSGTSGPNKIIAFTGEELSAQVYNAAQIIRDNPLIYATYNGYIKHLVVLPLYHVFGFIAVFLWFSFFNLSFIFPMNLSAEKIRQACLIAEPTHIFAVPLFFDTIAKKINSTVKAQHMSDKFNKGIKLSLGLQKASTKLGNLIVKKVLFANYLDEILGPSIQLMISGGAAISLDTLRIMNGIGYPLVNGYGSTEIGISSFTNPNHMKERLSQSIGRPFSGFTYEIRDNELYVKGASTFNKSLINGEWIKHNHDEPVKTYDHASKDGSNYYLHGRLDEIFINENGENYSLSEIETLLPIRNADSFVLFNPDGSKKLSLLISYSKSISKIQIALDLKALLASNEYRHYNIQDVYVTRLIFPKANGIKIKRKAAIDLFNNDRNNFELIKAEDYKNIQDISDFNKDVLTTVMEAFQAIFPDKTIKEDSDYFNDLGGNSLSYFNLVESLETSFNTTIPIDQNICRTPLEFTKLIMENAKL